MRPTTLGKAILSTNTFTEMSRITFKQIWEHTMAHSSQHWHHPTGVLQAYWVHPVFSVTSTVSFSLTEATPHPACYQIWAVLPSQHFLYLPVLFQAHWHHSVLTFTFGQLDYQSPLTHLPLHSLFLKFIFTFIKLSEPSFWHHLSPAKHIFHVHIPGAISHF